MDHDAMLATLRQLRPEEIRNAMFLIDLFERWGSLSPHEAAAWRAEVADLAARIVPGADQPQ